MPIQKIKSGQPYKNTTSISNVNMLANFTAIAQPPESANIAIPTINQDRPQKVEVVP